MTTQDNPKQEPKTTRYAVFCGSRDGNKEMYTQDGYTLGKTLAERNIELIYGGGSTGVMGAVARGCLDHHGYVTGIIPHFLQTKERTFRRVNELIITKDMHERKRLMHTLSDGFIILPGGLGTLEELFEAWTWLQLELHNKPLAVLNTENFYTPLFSNFEHMKQNGFVDAKSKLPIHETNIGSLLNAMESHRRKQETTHCHLS